MSGYDQREAEAEARREPCPQLTKREVRRGQRRMSDVVFILDLEMPRHRPGLLTK